MKNILIMILLTANFSILMAQKYESDIIETNQGNLEIHFIAHGTLMMTYNDLVIHIDPVGMFGDDYSNMPEADILLITHAHGDHFDKEIIERIRKDNTVVILTEECEQSLGFGEVMKNGDRKTVSGLNIEAVPAYNPEKAFHPKGVGNGYIIQFADKKVYIAGDTEDIPEMSDLKDIDIAFLPMNQPYTMTPEMAANAARMIMPRILYPYHYGETNTDELLNLLKDESSIEIRIRKMN